MTTPLKLSPNDRTISHEDWLDTLDAKVVSVGGRPPTSGGRGPRCVQLQVGGADIWIPVPEETLRRLAKHFDTTIELTIHVHSAPF